MKTKKPILNLKRIGAALLGLASTAAFAGDVTYNFDSGGNPSVGDPAQDPSFLVWGASIQTDWNPIDGNPTTGGYLAVCNASGGNLCVVFPDIDTFTNTDSSVISLPVKAFTIDVDLRVGNGVTEHGADGFSVSFVRPNDNILVNATNNTGTANNFTGFAGGDDAATAISAAGSGDAENGSKTGLSISFDTWQGNTLPQNGVLANSAATGNDTEGIEVRLDDVTLYQGRATNGDGSFDRNGNCSANPNTVPPGGLNIPPYPDCGAQACTDPNTMQTGPWTGGDGNPDILCWQPLHIELNTNKQVTVIWKGHTVVDHLQLGSYSTSRGRLTMQGRTGGNNQNFHVDNIHIVTVPDVVATFASIAPAGVAGIYGFTITFQSTGPSIVTNFSPIQIDGTDVTSATTLSTNGLFVSGTYIQGTRLAPGSTHTVSGNFLTPLGQSIPFSQTFVTPNWIEVPTNHVLPLAQVSAPGFIIKSWQDDWMHPQRNLNYFTDEMFEGYHGPNFADQSGAVNGVYSYNSATDFSSGAAGDTGFFPVGGLAGGTTNAGYDYNFINFGITPAGATSGVTNFLGNFVGDNCALELQSYLYFPTSGVYQMYVNSDDGFRIDLSANPGDKLGQTVMEFSGGRGVGNAAANGTTRAIIIDTPGAYPIRTTWENGGGGYAMEWYIFYPTIGKYILVNDDGSQSGIVSPVKAFQAAATTAPYVSYALPVKDGQNVPIDQNIHIKITDGTLAADVNSVFFNLDGATTPVTKSKTGNTIDLLYQPTLWWAHASIHKVILTYSDNATPTPNIYTNTYSFTVKDESGFPITQIPASWGIPTNQIDFTRPGFRVRSHQVTGPNSAATGPNTVQFSEEQLLGLHGPNIADETGATNNGFYYWPEVLDFSGVNGTGTGNGGWPYNFNEVNFGYVQLNTANPDNQAAEIGTWVVFPNAGVYTMVFNSDDGFKMSVSPRHSPLDNDGQVISWFNGGRGTAGGATASTDAGGVYGGTAADIYIPAPGAYPFRVMWENGGGGSGFEWTIFQHFPDGSYGNMLLNETNYPGAIRSYAFATSEPARIVGIASPGRDFADRLSQNHTLGRAQSVVFVVQAGTSALGTGSITATNNGVAVAVTVTPAGSNNLYIVSITPDINNPSTWWPSGADNHLTITFTDATGTYNSTAEFATEWYGTLSNGLPLGSGDPAKSGFLMRVVQSDQQGGNAIVNRFQTAEQVLAGLYGPNVINTFSNNIFTMQNGYFVISGDSATNEVINFDIGGPDGDFQPGNGHPEIKFPGIPGIGTGANSGHESESFAAEILTYVEFPTNGHYTMGFNSDDGFRITPGLSAPANRGSLVVGSPASIAGEYLAAPGTYPGTKQVTAPITGKLVQMLGIGGGTQNGQRPGVPIEGCPPIINGAAINGNIAVVWRGTCNFFEKLKAANDAGALAIVVINNRPQFSSGDGWFPTEPGGDPQIQIPTIEIAQTNGVAISAVMATNDVTATIEPLDGNSSVLGGADFGKGSSDVLYDVNVPTAGVYPLRALYWQGGGGANAEWFSLVGTNKVLLNDRTSTNGPALKTFYGVTGVVTQPTIHVGLSGNNVVISWSPAGGTLLSSATIGTGAVWTPVGTTNPATIPISGSAKFFRVQVQ